MVVNLAQVWAAKAYVASGGPRVVATGLRLTPQQYEVLLRDVRVQAPAFGEPIPSMLYGLAVHVDRYLAPGVWRLTGRDGALLYDSRQGRKGSEW